MNWRNPFLITYLSVTVAGGAILGFFVYSSYSRAVEVDNNYTEAVKNLQRLQTKIPFPNEENNAKYVEFTKKYRAEYDKLLAKAGSKQKSVEKISPEAFQDRLRSDVSQVVTAAKENNVQLDENFYLGFDQYRGTLPSEEAAGPLGRQLAAIRMIVDQLIQLKVSQIVGIKRDTLPEESAGAAAAPATPNRSQRTGGNTTQGRPQNAPRSNVVNANSFDIVFVADQTAARSALNFIASADQFFIIRNLTIQNSSLEGPKRKDDNAPEQPQPDATQPGGQPAQSVMRLLVGREPLTVSLRIEMVTFNNLPIAQK
jgi:hypothetical protein